MNELKDIVRRFREQFDDNCGCVWIDEVEASLLELEAYIRRTEEAQKDE